MVCIHDAPDPQDRSGDKADENPHHPPRNDIGDKKNQALEDLPVIDLAQTTDEEGKHGRQAWTFHKTERRKGRTFLYFFMVLTTKSQNTELTGHIGNRGASGDTLDPFPRDRKTGGQCRRG